jgi:hypothetical protein
MKTDWQFDVSKRGILSFRGSLLRAVLVQAEGKRPMAEGPRLRAMAGVF